MITGKGIRYAFFYFPKDSLRILISQRIHYGFTPEKV